MNKNVIFPIQLILNSLNLITHVEKSMSRCA